MPELPDVEVFRREVADDVVGKNISSIIVKEPKVIKGLSPATFSRKLKDKKITTTLRHGKNLFLELDKKEYLRIHFGMTGELIYENSESSLPRHTSFTIHLNSGDQLIFKDPRKFGEIEYISDIEEFLATKKIGPDIETLSQEEFLELFNNKKKGQIKPALMDQSFMSGLGNIYTDEVLFQAGIHPERAIDTLSDSDLKSIFKKTKSVLKEAIKDHANREEMPRNYLIHHRSQGEKCPQCKSDKVKMKKIGGRSTYFCSKCQD